MCENKTQTFEKTQTSFEHTLNSKRKYTLLDLSSTQRVADLR